MSPSPEHEHAHANHPRIHKVEYPAIASEEELKSHRVPVVLRDLCSKHLINYYQCMNVTSRVPWKCHPEKEEYEICEYKDFLRRMRKATRLREEAKRDGTGPVELIDEKLTSKRYRQWGQTQDD